MDKKNENYNQIDIISYIETQLIDIKKYNHKYRILKAAAEQTINFYIAKLKDVELDHKNAVNDAEKNIENAVKTGINDGYLVKETTCISAVIKKEKKGIKIEWI